MLHKSSSFNRPTLLVVGGATATGKTALAIRLAQHFGAAILSADSRQFYREMNIGTAKPSAEELRAAPHFFVDSHSVSEDFSVGDFEREALDRLKTVFEDNKLAILVGGSGLFLRAVCEGLDSFPPISSQTKSEVDANIESGGIEYLQTILQQLDNQYFSKIDIQNPARLRRAVEVCLETGRPYSEFLALEKTPRFFDCIYLLLEVPRAELYTRIDGRVDAMIVAGLEQEVRDLLPFRARPALRTVGYEEFFDFFDGKISREEAIQKIKQHSRNYAKRQATWFRKYGNWTVFTPEDWDGTLAFLTEQFG